MAAKNPFHAEHHIVPIPTYFFTLLALLALMIITVVVSYIQIPTFILAGTVWNQLFAMFIAVLKASLVVAIFMGVKWSTQLTKFWALLGFAWLSFFTIMMGDYGMRRFEVVQGWDNSGVSALPRMPGDTEGKQVPSNEINVRPRQ